MPKPDPFQLSPELVERIDQLKTDLDAEILDMRNIFDARSERWRDGERGVDVGGWLDSLDSMAEALEDYTHCPE